MMTPNNRRAWVLVLALGAMLPCCGDAWTAIPSSVSSEPSRTRSMPTGTVVVVPVGNRRGHATTTTTTTTKMIGTGFSFEDGEQILVSVQKPFGIVLEQREDDDDGRIVVTEVDPGGSAGTAGVREGDVLVAVQNASTVSVDLGDVLDFIATKCPRVVNLRFQRME